jgi:regulator of sigma E protease
MDIVLQSVLPFLAMIVVLIVVHELGHFVTAKLAGVQVLEFGLGYPPKLFGIKRGETEYTVNAVPLGGFVRLLGEEDPTHPRSLAAQPRWVRLVVLSSGAIMNVLLAIFLFGLALSIPREVDVSRARVEDVLPGSPAEEAGLKPGDIIFAVNGTEVESVGQLGYQIRLNLGKTVDLKVRRPGSADGGSEFVTIPVRARWSAPAYVIETEIAPGGSIGAEDPVPIELRVTSTEGFEDANVLEIDSGTPREERFRYCVEGPETLLLYERAIDGTSPAPHDAGARVERRIAQGPTGITIGPAYASLRPLTEEERRAIADELPPCEDGPPAVVAVPFSETQWTPPWEAPVEGAKRSWESVILARNEIISRIRGGVGGSGGFQVTGPVGIAQLTGEVVDEAGWKSLMDFAALISMNLAVLNILPLPMLDGGRVVFVLLEYVRGGRRVSARKEAMVHFVGLVAMLSLAVVITYFDVARIFGGEGILR